MEPCNNEEEHFLQFDGQRCFLGEKCFQPLVFLEKDAEKAIERGFNTVTIQVPLHTHADLSFQEALFYAKKAEEKGLKIVFEIDLGLFDRLPMPLESQVLFSTLTFALESFFHSTLKNCAESTLGLIVYKGNADFYPLLKKDFSLLESLTLWISAAGLDLPMEYKELEKREEGRNLLTQAFFEMGIRFIERVCQSLPENIPLFVLLDLEEIDSIALRAFLLNRERFERVHLVPKNQDTFHYGMSWEKGFLYPFAFFGTSIPLYSKKGSQETYGILLPPIEKKELSCYQEIAKTILFLTANERSLRLIPESFFANEWDEIDVLFIPQELSKEALRMVQGYLASEGKVVVLGESSLLPQIEPMSVWKRKFMKWVS